MKKNIFTVVLFTILISGTIQAQHQLDSLSVYSRIDKYLSAGSENGFSGAILVIKNGKIIINKGYGFANKKTQALNSSNTIFDIGSNTKQFTSTAILRLVELERLKLTDSLYHFFEGLPTDKQNITIHQLLSHTSGFKESIGKDFDRITTKQFFDELFASELISRPGERYSYSNIGYSILGRIIELVSGQTYEEFLRVHLFNPAGMKQTGYLLPKWNKQELSNSHNRGILESESSITKYKKAGSVTWHLKANGGINSTQNDMLLWYKALKTNKIISNDSFQILTTPYAIYPSGKTSYAYGWTVRNLENNIKRLAHNGSNGAYAHSLIWFPKEDVFISYATNANSSEVEFLAYEIAKIILDKDYAPKPIRNNVYAFAFNYIRTHAIDTSNELTGLLKANYGDEFSSSRLLNSIGNLLLMLNENIDWALELFKLNVQSYPDDGNLWDSLGDAYKANDNKDEAIKSYRKAIDLGYEGSKEKLNALLEH